MVPDRHLKPFGHRIDKLTRDLLADVIIYPDGFVKVVDLDEFEQALESGTLTMDDVKKALRSLDRLLRIIYDGNFDKLSDEIEIRIPKS